MDNLLAEWLKENSDICILGVMILWAAVSGGAFLTAILVKLGIVR